MTNNINTERFILENAIQSALDKLYSKDNHLIVYHLHEQCIGFRFGLYLYDELKRYNFCHYDLDAEYDHNISDKKRLPSWPDGARPDFIIHKRGQNIGTNICVIELKKGEDEQITDQDKKKIREFIEYEDYCYQCGVTILITQQRKDVKLHWEVR